jgi:2-(1,2-epoxy-1,2-dihydrophenyl)acetyl-CoA isomerase
MNGIAVLTLNRPERLNSFTQAMHREVRDALDQVQADKSVRVLVLTGAGRGFCAGQDLNDRAVEPGAPGVDLGESVEKFYAPLVMTLRTLPMPVICAVNGVAAGAGANLALACDIVLAAKSASFIEAFCKLGLIPDTGGTWALPRLIGPARAMGLALLGDKLPAEKAEQWGLIWRCVPDEALMGSDGDGRHFATRRPGAWPSPRKPCWPARPTRWNNSCAGRQMMRELGYSHDYREGVSRLHRKAPAAFQGGMTWQCIGQGQHRRRDRQRRHGRRHRPGRGRRRPHGAPVRHAAGRRRQGHRRHRQGLRQAGREGPHGRGRGRPRARAPAADARIDGEAARCALVVEAIVEDLDVKRGLFAELEGIVGPDCILATNTSSISVTAIAAGLQRPERLVGMHFFNPVPLMALVEVISGVATDKAVADTVYATAEAWGKNPVHAKSTPGFIVNRVARPYYAEALRLLQEQAADAATLDAVMRDCGGFRMGPFELMDLIGHDVNFSVTQSVFDAYFGDPRFTPSTLQQELVNAGFLGRKSGRGFFRYGEAWRAASAGRSAARLPEGPCA